jgi:hypothetical protein
VFPGCSNHTYDPQYGEQIQYLIKLQARIFTKGPVGPKERLQCHRNLSMDEACIGATGGEVGLVFIFWLLLVLLI